MKTFIRQFQIPTETHRAFEAKCAAEGRLKSEVLRELIQAFVAGKPVKVRA